MTFADQHSQFLDFQANTRSQFDEEDYCPYCGLEWDDCDCEEDADQDYAEDEP